MQRIGLGFRRLIGAHKTFAHGIYPLEHKELTAHKPIRRLPFADELIIHLQQHKGRPSVPIVKVGQEVVRGEPIAVADQFVSVPLHAPATGVIRAIGLAPTAEGPKALALFLKVYPAASQQVLYGTEHDIDHMSAQEIIQAVQDAGLVGLGGGAFPSHVKLQPPPGRVIHTLLVNGCECEPYLTCDHRIMLEQTEALIRGIRIALKATGAERAIIGVEDNKLDALSQLRARIPTSLPIRVEAVQTKYPQGAEKMLITALLGVEVPIGGLPADVGVAVFNVGTLAQMGELVPKGQGLIERVVTVSGPAVKNPGNFLVPIGTPVRFLLDQVGIKGALGEVILGGPMMGMAVASLDVPVTKSVSGVVALEPQDPALAQRTVYPCIKCGECLRACPVSLNPALLGELAAAREYGIMAEQFHLDQCFECGCCAFVCPSNIPLTQYFRIAKSINRDRRQRSLTTNH
ncbi:electron transport complex subunit RsxC [Thermochromatium tepidum]|jgi:electron transport complex, RnfABCDGE type, C subunit|uniref:Ion-translocating oxidoreductase complex subunit C n=1 Tax=Thermochromatium tepidum ATCC 43061 TaxID=316276 RepID=A0A6I6E7X6_THETI|nr:electron transport complex subunit RsxC [Thermochromatium tepidum]QGU33992.1 electron transport complex subunit RsxC [Thermochromatium tepidum ATCC 43061]